MQPHSRAFLLILDGWGLGPKPSADAIFQADTPYFDGLMQQYPHSTLVTFGEEVGLPEGQMGNSEVGHLNIGAGRIVWQELARINKAVRDRELHDNQTLLAALDHAKRENRAVHLIGLVSDGGVHSHLEHLKALCDIAVQRGCPRTFVHAFTDGRDCDPKSGAAFIGDLAQHLENKPVQIAAIIGRYYAMDRDKRWERIRLAYDLLVNGIGETVTDPVAAIQASYAEGVTDEFLKPLRIVQPSDDPLLVTTIQPNDVVISFNFRTDRCREITEVLTQHSVPDQDMYTLPLYYVTMTRYDHSFQNIHVLFEKDDVTMTLGEVLELSPQATNSANLPLNMGGPVEPNTLHFLHRRADLPGAQDLGQEVYWGGDFDVLLGFLASGAVSAGEVRLFAGYSGWSAGQLAAELARGSWIKQPASAGKVFTLTTDAFWREVLREKGGRFKVLANYPIDPRLN